jgi:hypothetical protein
MAAPPSTASPASWNPAVPPPPVMGAAVGNGLNEGVGEGLRLALGEGLGLTLTLLVGLEVALVPSLAEVLAETLTEPLAVGENTLVPGVPEDVQAETATQASTLVRPQPTAVSLTRCAVHAMAARAFIRPPRAPAKDDHFPAGGPRNRYREGKA